MHIYVRQYVDADEKEKPFLFQFKFLVSWVANLFKYNVIYQEVMRASVVSYSPKQRSRICYDSRVATSIIGTRYLPRVKRAPSQKHTKIHMGAVY